MPKLILGDNPFFAISHLSPEKSNDYIKDPHRLSNAATIINSASDIGIDLMMISSHSNTKQLLDISGYPHKSNLPDICLVVPNVHELNNKAASRGIEKVISLSHIVKVIFKSINIKKTLRRLIVKDIEYPQVKYLALHNVIVDMLIGLQATIVLRMFAFLCRFAGYKAVFLTLNPTKLLSKKIKGEAICTYYNPRGYNVTVPIDKTLKEFRNQKTISEIWAMGIMASGAVSIKELKEDIFLQQFSRLIIASSKYKNLKLLSKILNHD